MNNFRFARKALLLNMCVMARDGVESEFTSWTYPLDEFNTSSFFVKTALQEFLELGFLIRSQKRDIDGVATQEFLLTARALALVERCLQEVDVEIDVVRKSTDDDDYPVWLGPTPYEVANSVSTEDFENRLGLSE